MGLQPELSEILEAEVLSSTRKGRGLSSAERTRRARVLASRVMAEFLASLDPNYAVAVLHQRFEKRLDDLDQRLGGDLDLEPIPPACWESLEHTYEANPGAARTVVQVLVDVNDVDSLASVVFANPQPGWLSASPPSMWVVIGQYFSSHGAAEHASTALERAASAGARGRQLLEARAALAISDVDRGTAKRLIDQATSSEEKSVLVLAVRAFLNESPEEILTLLPDALAIDGVDDQLLAVSLRVAALIQTEQASEAADLLRRAIEAHHNRGSLRLRLADALVLTADALPIGSADHDALLLEAAQHAEAAIEIYRKWRGPSSQAVEVACGLYLSTGQLSKVTEIGRLPPGGRALPGEPTPKSQTAVTIALIASGETEAAAEIISDEGATEFQRTFLKAEAAAQRGDPGAVALFAEAVGAADDDSEKMFALMGLARIGSAELPGLDELRSTQPEWSALVEATAALNSDDPDRALQISAKWRTKAAPHADLHARALAEKGESDAAVQEYVSAAHRFGSGHFVAEAVQLLANSGSLEEAEALAARGLALFPAGQSVRWRLRRQILEIAELRRDWGAYESHARTLIAEFPDEPMAKWAVVYSLYVRQRRSDAWDELHRLGNPPVVDERTAVMKIDLEAQFDPGHRVVEEAFTLARRFPDSEGVLGIALKAAWTGTGEEPLPEELAEEARETLESFQAQFPESELLQQVKLDLDDLIGDLRPMLEPHARALEDMLAKIRFGELPSGLALAVRRLPYATYHSLYGAGLLCSISPNPDVQAADRAAAADSLDSVIVVETSAFVPAMYLGSDFWPSEHFSALLLPEALRDDAIAAVDEAKSAVPTSMNWDLHHDRPIFHEATQDDLSKNVERAETLFGLIDQCTPVNASAYPLPDVRDGDFEPWISCLRLAHAEGVALLSEDLALRNLARGFGIPAFNTYALIEVLEEQDSLDERLAEHRRRDLLRAFVMDLPFDEHRLFVVAEEDDFKAGAATAAFSRPAAWIDPSRSLAFFRTVISFLAEQNMMDRIPFWLAAASVGAASNAHPSKRSSVLGFTLMSAIVHSGIGSDNAAALVEASRSVVSTIGLDPTVVDPLRESIPLVRGIVSETVGPGQVGPTVLAIFRSLSEEDRMIVVRELST